MDELIRVVYCVDRSAYCVPDISREGQIWLGVECFPLPVPPELHRPGLFGAVVMPGRDYWRRFTAIPQREGAHQAVAATDPLIADWRDAAWWSPGLEEQMMPPTESRPRGRKTRERE